MHKYIAFLRAINVGGRNIKMADLRSLFRALDLKHVETLIASGNVIFDPPAMTVAGLERKIAEHLHESLGYEVDTFIRSTSQLAQIARYQPFGDITLSKGGNTLKIGFLSTPLTPEAHNKLLTRRTHIDDFHVNGQEVYWLSRKAVGKSRFSGSVLEKAIKAPATLRNVNTIRRLVAKYAVEGAA